MEVGLFFFLGLCSEKESEFWIAKLKTANVVLFSLQVMPNPTMCTVQFKVDVV